jgi:PAS domain S-box-containing protein
MTRTMDHIPQLDRGSRRAALDQEMYDRLASAPGVLAVMYAGYAVAHALGLEPDLRGPLVLSTATSALAMAALATLVRRGAVSVRRVRWLGAAVSVVVMLDTAVYLMLSGEPALTMYLMLAFVASGLVFLSWRVMLLTFVLGWGTFLLVAAASGPDQSWRHFGVGLATSTAVAVVVHGARVRATLRVAALREAERERTLALHAALRSLAESEQRHRDLVENDLGIILTHDVDGRILSANPSAAATLGRERESLAGTPLGDVLAAGFLPQLGAYLERAQARGRDTGTMRVATPDGRERLWDYLSVLQRERDRPPYVLLHAHDITDRVELENRLRAARGELASRVRSRTLELEAANAALREEIDERRRIGDRLRRYGHALEACSDAIILTELDGRIADVNASVVALCAASGKAELVGLSLVELAAPEDRERAARGVAEVIGGVGGPPQEFALLQLNGQRVPVEAGLAVVRDESGAPCALVAVGRDITWRKQMESSLRHSEAYLRTLIRHSTDTIVVLDVDGTVLARPDGTDDPIGRFGHTRANLLGRLGQDFVHPDDFAAIAAAFVRAVEAPTRTASVECRLRDGAGRYRPSQLVLCNLLEDPAVGGVMCSIRDLSERKQAEAELREARDAAEAASQAKSEFLNTMSHELRTPIHAVLGYAEMLDDGAFGALNREQREIVQRITDRARDQFELIAAVLDLSAMEAGRMVLQASPVHLADVCAEVEREGRKTWTDSGLAMRWDVPDDLPELLSDAAKIRIVLRNLVGNAVKFTARGSVTTRARAIRDGVEISVTDTGIGIPADQRDAIFAPFYQLDGSESRRYEGSGLGLHIVKRLLGLLGGDISVDSEVGRGSTFRVWLPLRPVRDAAGDAVVTAAAPSPGALAPPVGVASA